MLNELTEPVSPGFKDESQCRALTTALNPYKLLPDSRRTYKSSIFRNLMRFGENLLN